jgi:hypothetical protein
MRGLRAFLSISLMVVVLSIAVSIPMACAVEVLYGVTFEEQLITIDTSTGAGTLVGSIVANSDPYGLGTSGGNLYTFDQTTDTILQLNPSNGSTINSINIGLPDLIGEGGLAFRSDGTGFLSTASSTPVPPLGLIYTFLLSPPSSALLGSHTDVLDGLDFDAGDVLYGLTQIEPGQETHQLVTVNQSTAALSVVGDTGVVGTPLAGLAFASDGTLFAAMDDVLYTINPTNAQATSIGPIGFANVSGLTFLDTTPPPAVPTPASIVLIAAGLIVRFATMRVAGRPR